MLLKHLLYDYERQNRFDSETNNQMQWQKQQIVETHAVYLKVTKQVSDQKEIILIYIIKSSDYTWRSKKIKEGLICT